MLSRNLLHGRTREQLIRPSEPPPDDQGTAPAQGLTRRDMSKFVAVLTRSPLASSSGSAINPGNLGQLLSKLGISADQLEQGFDAWSVLNPFASESTGIPFVGDPKRSFLSACGTTVRLAADLGDNNQIGRASCRERV